MGAPSVAPFVSLMRSKPDSAAVGVLLNQSGAL